jgi:hypothetical protein
MTKLGRMRWIGHVARKREMHTGFLFQNMQERDQLEDTSMNGKAILKWILNKYEGLCGLDSSGSV